MPAKDPATKETGVKDKPGGAASHDAALAMIRTAMIEKKITQASLADAADCHEKTIQNLLAGKAVRAQTLFDVCVVLGLKYETIREIWSGEARPAAAHGEAPSTPDAGGMGGVVAPIYMGAYTRAGVDHYLGSYLTLRPAFSTPRTIVAYRTDVTWDDSWPSLLFQEVDRPDQPYSHRGRLYIPPSSMFIHLVSLTKGAMRMVVVSQIDQAGQMRGLITTLNKQRAVFVPVAAPIVYMKTDDFSGVKFGEVVESDAVYRNYRQMLAETVEQGYARLVGLADAQTQ